MPRLAHQVGRFVQRSFDHLVVKHRKKDYKPRVPPRVNSVPAFVHAKDRIPLWNISSGDRVRVNAGDHKGKIGTVNYVDREKNRVFLSEPEFAVSPGELGVDVRS
jgi:transcription antitermination factor NusG